MSTGPVFVGGLSFSGKTPLRIALSAHPRLALSRHTALWSRFNGRFGDLRRDENLSRCLQAMLADRGVGGLGLDPERVAHEFRQGAPTYARLFELVHTHHAQRLGKARWGEQSKRLEADAQAIMTAYPDARMVHMVRDPRARHVPAAQWRVPGKLGWETARWRHSVDLALRHVEQFSDRYRIVRYEDLTRHPETTLRRLAAFLGEEYHPAMAVALAASRPHDPLRDQDADAGAFIERHAPRQLAALGYPVVTRHTRGHARSRVYAVEWPCNRAGLAMWRTWQGGALASRGRS